MDNNVKNENKSELYKTLRFLYKARFFILIFILISLIASLFSNQQIIENQYEMMFQLDSYSTSGKNEMELLNSLNYVSNYEKAKKLKISPQICSQLTSINVAVENLQKSPDIQSNKPVISIVIRSYNKSHFQSVISGMIQLLKSDPFLKKEFENYQKRRKIRSEILNTINLEVKTIEKRFKNFEDLDIYPTRSNADLYRLKLELDYESINPSTPFEVKYIGTPMITPSNLNSIPIPLFVSIIGFIIGLLAYYLYNNGRNIKTQLFSFFLENKN